MKKILLDGYWFNNLGDDLFAKIILERYKKYRDLEFVTYVKKGNEGVFSEFKNIQIRYKRSSIKEKLFYLVSKFTGMHFLNISAKLLNEISKFDAVIEIGGSIFIMGSQEHVGFPYYFRKKVSNVAKRYFVIGSNFGPFYTEDQRKKYSNFFAKITGTVFRDNYSRELFPEVTNMIVAPDVVFNLDVKKYKVGNNGVVIAIANKFKDDLEKETFLKELVKYIESELVSGERITLMSFCEHEGDPILSKEILERLSERDRGSVNVVNYSSIDESLRILGSSKKIIAMRYHAMILAWLLEKEVNVISYSQKTTNVINDLFPEQVYNDVSKFRGDSVIFSKLDTNRLQKYVREASKQFMYLDNWLNSEGEE